MSHNYHLILQKPIITEKSMKAQESAKYTFLVPKKTNKIEIKKAVEKLYRVKVTAVNSMRVCKKARKVGRGRFVTKRQETTKVIVTLKKGESLDVAKVKDK